MDQNSNVANQNVNAKNDGAGSKSGGVFSALDNNKSGNSPLDNIKTKASGAAMRAMGVPKPLANMAANRLTNSKRKQNNVPEALKKRNSGMPNSKGLPSDKGQGKDGDSQDSKTNSANDLSNTLSNNNEKTNQKANGDEKGTVQNTAEKAVAKGGSAAMQAAGVPKPIADMIAKKASGPALKIAIISAIGGFLLWLIIIVAIISITLMPILKGLALIKEVKEGISNFFNSSWNFVIGNGYCPSLEECALQAEEKFYDKVPKVKEKYPNVDMSLVLSSVLYGAGSGGRFNVGNYDECANEDPQKQQDCENDANIEGYQGAKDNLSKVAKKLSDGKETYDEYMIKTFIPKNYSEYLNGNTDAQKILDEIYLLSSMFNDYKNVISNNSTGGVCSYSVNGVDVSEIKVRLLNCSWDSSDSPAPIAGEELIDFEKYILGVSYGENDGAPEEGIKAQAIAARSVSLVRPKNMGGNFNLKLEQENGQWILQLRNCTADHVYCDPDKGCWSDSSSAGDTVHSGYVEGKAWSKPVLAEDSYIRKAVASVKGMVLIDDTGKIVYSGYTSVEQNKWNDKANGGQDYTSILLEEYSSAKTIKANCSASMSGDWATWRQKDPRWESVPLGNNTLGNVGCLVTSFAIQIARSGTAITLPSGVSEFNPGTFVKYSGIQFSEGGAYLGGDQWTKEMAPGFVRVGSLSVSGTKQEKINKIAEYINQGYFLVAQVKYPTSSNNTHFVAVVGTNGNDIIMADPASDATELFAKYPSGASSSVTLIGSIFKRTD